MTNIQVHVEGMTCDHCVATVTTAVNSLGGINQISVDLDNNQVNVDFDENQTNLDAISAKIAEVGFEVISN